MSRRRSQRGFTLVELMVALTLFAILISGVLAVAVSMAQAYREQRQVTSTEASVRGAMDFISDALRGLSPGVASGNIQDVQTCTIGAISVVNSTTGPDQMDVVVASGAVVTSLRTAYTVGGATSTAITVTDASQLAAGDTLLITNATVGHLVHVNSVNTSTGAVTLVAPACVPGLFPAAGYPVGSLVIRAVRARFRIGTFDGISNVLLMDVDADGLNEEPLAENIEDMQIAIGVDVNGDTGIATTEWAFSSGTGALAGPIRALRVSLVSIEGTAMRNVTGAFLRPAAEDHPVATAPDAFRRRVLKSTVEIRNLGDSP
ncbi:MAG: Type Pilus-assembly protein [Deltaproteobacteria bacterium]|nr:Type Pilus-assembly protein [Deltaproteobacteria bacterium]